MSIVTLGQRTDGTPAVLDLSAFTGSHACVIANSGGGKSGLIRRLLETTHGQVLQIVLDAEDEFYTLREKFPAFVIAGGDGGDVPISTATAGPLALATLEHNLSLVVQLNDLPDREAFVGAFLSALVNAPAKLWRPALVIVDEAHRFAPEGSTVESSAGVKALLERGRKRGLTAVLASQRMAKVAKTITAEVNNWFLGRVGQATDRRVAADALGFSPSGPEARGLQSLPPRTFWAFGPAMSPVPVQFRVGDVATTIIRAGQSKVPTPPAPSALQKILKELAATVPAPESPAVSVAADAHLLARLQADLAQTEVQRDRAEAERDHALTELDEARRELQEVADYMAESGKTTRECGDGFEVYAKEIRTRFGQASLPRPLPAGESRPPEPKPKPPVAPSAQSNDAGLSPKQQQILDALAWLASIGNTEPTTLQIGALALIDASGGHFSNVVGPLSAGGLITRGNGRLSLTDAGRKVAKKPEQAVTLAHYHAILRDRVRRARSASGKTVAILDALIAARGKPLTVEQIGNAVGIDHTGGHFSNTIGPLSTIGLITRGGGVVRPTNILFPSGL